MKYKVVYSDERVSNSIRLLGSAISDQMDLSNTLILVVLTGGDYLFNRLAQFWGNSKTVKVEDLEVNFIKGHSYSGSRRKSFIWDLFPDKNKVQGRDILVIDDFADSGNTINIINEQLKNMGANLIQFATLLRRDRCMLAEGVNLVSAIVDNSDTFFVGCGLDDNGKARYINYIGAV